jgi:Arc/MetJ family transcription regulator
MPASPLKRHWHRQWASLDLLLAHLFHEPPFMRTTVNLDQTLLEEAQRMTGLTERTAVIREGLKALIERESARRLARLGGSEPQAKRIPRRRSDPS